MKTTAEFVDALRVTQNWTDYRIAQVLGVQRSAVSHWRQGRRFLSDENAVQVAHLLSIEPEYVIACAARERCDEPLAMPAYESLVKRATTPQVRKLLRHLAQHPMYAALRARAASILLPLIAIIGLGALPGRSEAASFQGQADSPSLYIMFNYGRKWIAALKRLLGASPPRNVTAPAF